MSKKVGMFLIVGFMAMSGISGYFFGMYRAITESEITCFEDSGLIVVELDGQTYIHVLGG